MTRMGKGKRKRGGAQFSFRKEQGRQLTSSPKVRIKTHHQEMFERGYVTADMVAVKLGVHFSTVLRWGRKSYLETHMLHGQYYLLRSDVVDFIRVEQPKLEEIKGVDLDDWSNIFVLEGDETYLRSKAA